MNMVVQADDLFFVSDPPRWVNSLGAPLVFSLCRDSALVMSAIDAAVTITRLQKMAAGQRFSMVRTERPINYSPSKRSTHA